MVMRGLLVQIPSNLDKRKATNLGKTFFTFYPKKRKDANSRQVVMVIVDSEYKWRGENRCLTVPYLQIGRDKLSQQ